MSAFEHISVMREEVVHYMAPRDGEVYVDGTLGGAGYSLALLAQARCRVYGIDRDPQAIAHAQTLHDGLISVRGRFGDVRELVPGPVNGFMLDLGVSSVQIDTPERGFSFRFDGPLDMRMNPDEQTETAADIVNTYDEKPLADLIYKYGEERKSRHIAAAIVKKRAESRFETTFQLAELIRQVVKVSPKDKLDPSTRTFQALRIAVNDELGELERALQASLYILKPGGRLVVVSFHSLEDSIVKAFLREQSGQMPAASRYAPVGVNENRVRLFDAPDKKAVFPSEAEARRNPRARSARLRWAVRTDVPVDDLKI
ncbi:MAG: 16S rRNA (cytosine(1402)-N(4))-methyltransferase RsmH [Rhodospirillales bacterium]|nr:16S rRNA (cytosine(1402)-N(4))-methyltransferase RsmH [Rhodospirillales bacterium]MCB9979717.1 16S rRNA (cytosine(1402)-N(4))-methyltransferase RsmH [Rhodospirillales bacterium]